MSPELERAKPAWEQVKDHLAGQIADGWLSQGQRVPSVRELAAEWNVSPGTANRALDALASARLVTRDNRGTFVARPRLVAGPQARYRQFRFPPAERVEVVAAGYLERCPKYVQPILGLEPVREDGLCAVIRRQEVRYGKDGRPFILTSEWVRPEYAEPCPELSDPRRQLPLPGGALALIEARTDDHPVRGRFSCEARLPQDDGRELPLLELSVTEPVLGAVWVWYGPSPESKTLCYTEMTVRPERVIEAEWEQTR
jgi:GntR family transcriptional regulator